MKLIKKLLISIVILMLPLSYCSAREIITGTENKEGETVLTDGGLEILNEELRQQTEDIKDNASDILWETADGDTELKTADDVDMQNKQIKGLVIENRTNDTGCTQTGRIWYRSDL